MNLNEQDLHKLCAGRLTLSPADLDIVADTLNTSFSSLVSSSNSDSYQKRLNCRTNFSDLKNCDKILDVIDSYIDIKESI